MPNLLRTLRYILYLELSLRAYTQPTNVHNALCFLHPSKMGGEWWLYIIGLRESRVTLRESRATQMCAATLWASNTEKHRPPLDSTSAHSRRTSVAAHHIRPSHSPSGRSIPRGTIGSFTRSDCLKAVSRVWTLIDASPPSDAGQSATCNLQYTSPHSCEDGHTQAH